MDACVLKGSCGRGKHLARPGNEREVLFRILPNCRSIYLKNEPENGPVFQGVMALQKRMWKRLRYSINTHANRENAMLNTKPTTCLLGLTLLLGAVSAPPANAGMEPDCTCTVTSPLDSLVNWLAGREEVEPCDKWDHIPPRVCVSSSGAEMPASEPAPAAPSTQSSQ